MYRYSELHINNTIMNAMQVLEESKKGFVILLDDKDKVVGTITDGDIRREIISGTSLYSDLKRFTGKGFEYLTAESDFYDVVKKFEREKIDFLPILNSKKELVNILTKDQFQELLLTGNTLDLMQNFEKYNSKSNYEIIARPWGFYKTIFLSEFVQAKIIHVFPKEQLSLQYHLKREEHWIVVKGSGMMTLAKSHMEVKEGQYLFIPLGCEHRIKNNSEKELLIIAEVQLGSYFGEDDIIRVSDQYGRV